MKKLTSIINDFANRMNQKNIAAFASGTAFFFLLSVIPMLILVCSILPYTALTEENLLSAICLMIPEVGQHYVYEIVGEIYGKNAGVLSVAAVVTIWSSSTGMLSLMRGFNAIDDIEEKRNYFVLRMIACLYTLLFLASILISLAFNVFWDRIKLYVEMHIETNNALISFLDYFNGLPVFLFLIVAFDLIYAFIPTKKKSIRSQLPGAVFSALVWEVFSWAFSLYVTNVMGFSTYGSLTTIVLLLMWIYACFYIILIGAYINYYFYPAFKVFLELKRARKDKENT